MADKIISKGFYTHPGIPNFVCAKQYVITRSGKENHLFFRFENPKNELLTAISFSVDCYDSDGRIIKTAKVEQNNLKVKGHDCFVVNRPVVLDGGCVDFKVTVNSAGYGDYCYVTHGNDVEVTYEPQNQSGAVDRVPFLHKLGGNTHKAAPKTVHTPRFFMLLASAVVLSLFLILGIKIYNFTRTEELFTLDMIDYTFATDDRKDGPIIIVGCNSNASNIIVPDRIEGHDVVAIADKAFAKTNVRNIQFKGTIEIRDNAFVGASKLQSVIIESTNGIGARAFYNCQRLTDISIDKGLLYIGESAFENCYSLTTVSIPRSLESVDTRAFSGCYSLVELAIPESTTSIGKHVLYNCRSLASLEVPFIGSSINEPTKLDYFFDSSTPYSLENLKVTKMKEIGDNLFAGEAYLKTVSFSAPVTSIGANAFEGCISLKTFDIPASVTEIGTAAFSGCSTLESAVIPSNVTEIKDRVFNNCSSLKSVEIPQNVTYVGEDAFRNCYRVESLVFPESVTYIGSAALQNCKGLKTLVLPFLGTTEDDQPRALGDIIAYGSYCDLESFTLLSGETLPDYTFSDFRKLTSVTLPGETLTIGFGCFMSCQSLSDLTIPSRVTTIGGYAFWGCSSLESVEVPNRVESAGEYAFAECSALESVSFANNSTSIGTSIFENCSALTSVNLPSSIKSIPVGIFKGCASLQHVMLPSNITTIPNDAFSGCTLLQFVDLPKDITTIGNYAFQDCSSLTTLTIPDSVVSMGYGMLAGTTNLENVTLPYASGSVDSYNGFRAFFAENTPEKLSTVTLTKATQIPDSAFSDMSSLHHVNLPDTLTSIGESAFYGCTSLNEVLIPASVTYMSYDAFWGCTRLYEVTNLSGQYASFDYAIRVFTSEEERDNNKITSNEYSFIFSDYDSMWYLTDYDHKSTSHSLPSNVYYRGSSIRYALPSRLFSYNQAIEEVNISSAVSKILDSAFECCPNLTKMTSDHNTDFAEIGNCAFLGCSSLSEISIPYSTTRIGDSAFCNTGITSVNIPASVTEISNYAFQGCGRLETLSFGEGSYLGTIGEYAFEGTAISSIDLPLYLTSIGCGAFQDCSKLASVYLPYYLETINSNAFCRCSSLKTVTFDECAFLSYIGDEAFSGTAISDASLPSSLDSIGSCAFYDCNSLQNVTFPDYNCIKYVGSYAFYSCDSLASVVFGNYNNLSSIEDAAFSDCYALSNVDFGNNSSSYYIGSCAFQNCYELTNVTFGSGSQLDYIGSYAFQSAGLNSIVLPASLKQIGSYAFCSCNKLTSIKFEDNSQLNSIYDYAFDECYSLSNVDFGSNSQLTSIGSYAFRNTKLTSIVFPASLEYIYSSAFYNCDGLTSVSFEDNSQLRSIGYQAFYDCNALEFVDFGKSSSLNTISEYAFYSTAITKIDLPASLNYVCNYAFGACSKLTSVTLRNSYIMIDYYAFTSNNIEEVYNLGELYGVYAGSDSHGGVALNAIIVHTDENAEPLTDVEVNGFRFKKSDNHWFLMGLAEGNNATELVFDSFDWEGEEITSYVIYKNAFANNSSITSVTIRSAVSEIMQKAFYECSGMTTLAFDEDCTLTQISDYAFAYCSGITSLVLPDSLTTIKYGAFLNCNRLNSVLLPQELTNIEWDAFNGCYNLYDVINKSSITLTPGESYPGYVAYYALAVREDSKPLEVEERTTNNAVAKFVRYNNEWYLVSCTTPSYDIVDLPVLEIESKIQKYHIFRHAFTEANLSYGIILPKEISGIDSGALNYIYWITIYYTGSAEDWSALGITTQNVYTYVDCVHEYGTWTYDESGSININTSWIGETVTEPTCKETGEMKYTCSVCKEERTEKIPTTDDHTAGEDDDYCTVCGKEKQWGSIIVTPDNFASLECLNNDAAYPFAIDEGGIITSQNHAHSSSSSITITATKEMTVSFSYSVSSYYSDYLTFYLNGEYQFEISGTYHSYYSYSVTLNEGDILTLSYSKNSGMWDGNDCAYIKDLVVGGWIFVEPEEKT